MCLHFRPSMPADAPGLHEYKLCRQPGNCAHMCVVHVNNATSCVGWKTPGHLPACGDWMYNGGCELLVGEGGKGGGGGEVGGSEARGVVSRDKARQMGQTMRQRYPPCMSTTPPSLLQSSAILLSLPMYPNLTFLLLRTFLFCCVSQL